MYIVFIIYLEKVPTRAFFLLKAVYPSIINFADNISISLTNIVQMCNIGYIDVDIVKHYLAPLLNNPLHPKITAATILPLVPLPALISLNITQSCIQQI